MKLNTKLNYTPYIPVDQDKDIPTIVSVKPTAEKIYIECINFGNCATLFYGKRNESEKLTKQIDSQQSYFDAEKGCEYEFYVELSNGTKSKTRLAIAGDFPATVIDYLHPEDESYSHSGRFLASPFVLRTPKGNLLSTLDVFSIGYPQNLTKVFISHNDGLTWEYVTDLFPNLWASLFVYGDKVYAISCSKEYGDIQISCSNDEGQNWSIPTVLARGSSFGSVNGFHKAPVPIVKADKKFAIAVEYGCWATKTFNPFVLSFTKGTNPMVVSNWSITEYTHYDDLGFENNPCAIEGNLIVGKDKIVYDILRYQQGKALYLEVQDFDKKLKKYGVIDFPFAHTKFYIQQYKGKYYAIGNEFPGRNILSLATSDDGIHWQITKKLLDYSQYSINDVGLQYPSFFIENDFLYIGIRVAFNGAKSFHDTNSICFLKEKI